MKVQKKKPLRKCLGCQEQFDKRELIRVVKPKEENVSLDKTGRKNGRGAYICNKKACLEKALSTRAIERSLKCSISPELKEELLTQIGEDDE